ncbi:hypothetical protein C7K25_06455 [Gulosibacter molinativorax]|uniref:Uncharacterized protein n=1 Tax=Gulosibacter molinativorax TaxID=256821 RepID=A0ABT7C732_9MICO|nr:hypothetical protein [Gulosibacter molinativorax]
MRDIYDRILTGELLDPRDAEELLYEYLEDGELKSLPDNIAIAFELDAHDSAQFTVQTLWNAAHDTSLMWDHEYTDTDRIYATMFSLHDDAEIYLVVFGSIFDREFRENQRGVGAITAGAWKFFDASCKTPITVTVDSCTPKLVTSTIAGEIADAFNAAGLETIINEDQTVTVYAKWRHHVLPYEDAVWAASLAPRG